MFAASTMNNGMNNSCKRYSIMICRFEFKVLDLDLAARTFAVTLSRTASETCPVNTYICDTESGKGKSNTCPYDLC